MSSVQTSRPSTQECVDAVTFIPDSSDNKRYEILVEGKSSIDEKYVKDKIHNALERQDSNANVSFIVIDKFPEKEIQFDLTKIRALDRSGREGRRFMKGALLNARVFLVNIDDSRKVILEPMDGKPRHEAAECVIFVIALSIIDRSYPK